MLTKEFLIKDILDYEVLNDVNILAELADINIFIILDLIKIGNKCSDEDAENILNKALETKSIHEIAEELAYEIIGNKPDEKEECIDSKSVKSFSDILEDFYTQIQTVDKNLSLSDFWNISTKYMYKYADGLQKRFVYNTNNELTSQYTYISMLMSALAGKLKKCPQIKEDGYTNDVSLRDKLIRAKQERGVK